MPATPKLVFINFFHFPVNLSSVMCLFMYLSSYIVGFIQSLYYTGDLIDCSLGLGNDEQAE